MLTCEIQPVLEGKGTLASASVQPLRRQRGLSSEEAARRLQQYGPNATAHTDVPVWQVLVGKFIAGPFAAAVAFAFVLDEVKTRVFRLLNMRKGKISNGEPMYEMMISRKWGRWEWSVCDPAGHAIVMWREYPTRRQDTKPRALFDLLLSTELCDLED